MTRVRAAASFRDPSGFVFSEGGTLYRQVNSQYQEHYDQLMGSGLYRALVEKSWLVAHEEVSLAAHEDAYRVLKPQRIPYVSYPYEWCFSQLKAAALLTLDIQIKSLSFGMSLKDASAYNVQFAGHRPVFIDTLSFETYRDGTPWVAYRQFCQHFLAPLALMAHADGRLRRLLTTYIDGIPLDLASALLPARSRLRPGLLAHLHVHARTQRRYQDAAGGAARAIPRLPRQRLLALLDSLRRTVLRCTLRQGRTEWSHYYDETNYSDAAMSAKASLVQRMVDTFAEPGDVIHDIGANTGRFSRLLATPGRYVVSHDIDDLAVERNHLENRSRGVDRVLPLVLDLANPAPSIGWGLAERSSALERMAGGTVVALALVHHLAISNNVPLPHLADVFGRIARTLIIEFVPKEDSQVQRLLATREDIFPGYRLPEFELAFSSRFEIVAKEDIPGTCRTLFAMRFRA
jgi:ribosomal protein L11 methylase PrmA